MNIFSTLGKVTDLYHILEDGEDSKELFRFVASLCDCYTDGKIDLDILVKRLSDKKPAELAMFVKQAQLIVDQSKLIAAALGEE